MPIKVFFTELKCLGQLLEVSLNLDAYENLLGNSLKYWGPAPETLMYLVPCNIFETWNYRLWRRKKKIFKVSTL